MAHGFKHGGGGGSGLDFRVLDGLEQPASPRENDIWVACEGMTGWLFSATEPESPSEGMVWIKVGASSPAAFNAVKKNTVMIYPLAAAQYISGEWAARTAKSYVGGRWVAWTIYLFNNGDQCVDLTGGWEEVSKPTGCTITIGETLYVNSGTKDKTATISSSLAIDLTDVDTLWVNAKDAHCYGYYYAQVVVSTQKNLSNVSASVTMDKNGLYSIDVSGLTGQHYVLAWAKAGTYGDVYLDVSEMWIE